MQIILTHEVISADILQIFFQAISAGILTGLVVGLIHRVTWWIW